MWHPLSLLAEIPVFFGETETFYPIIPFIQRGLTPVLALEVGMRCESAGLESCVLHLQLVQGCAHDLNQARIRLSPVAMLLGKNCPDTGKLRPIRYDQILQDQSTWVRIKLTWRKTWLRGGEKHIPNRILEPWIQPCLKLQCPHPFQSHKPIFSALHTFCLQGQILSLVLALPTD